MRLLSTLLFFFPRSRFNQQTKSNKSPGHLVSSRFTDINTGSILDLLPLESFKADFHKRTIGGVAKRFDLCRLNSCREIISYLKKKTLLL